MANSSEQLIRDIEDMKVKGAYLITRVALEAIADFDDALLEQLLFRIKSYKNGQGKKYVLLNARNEEIPAIVRLLPGMRSPSILPLADEGWSSVHSVISDDDFWEIIDELKRHGAEGILVVPIEKMIL